MCLPDRKKNVGTDVFTATGSSIGGLAGGNLGIFCSVVFEGEEQRTPVVLEPKWDNCMLE